LPYITDAQKNYIKSSKLGQYLNLSYGWTETDANQLSVAFWDFAEKNIAELIGTKKFESITINPEN
jgi:hypothetical protein